MRRILIQTALVLSLLSAPLFVHNVPLGRADAYTVIASISTDVFYPRFMIYNPINRDIYASAPGFGDVAGSVYVIDSGSNSVKTSIIVGVTPDGEALDPSTGNVYVTDRDSNSVSVINSASNSIVASIDLGNYATPQSVFYNPSDANMYVLNAGAFSRCSSQTRGSVAVINPSTNSVIASIPTETAAEGFAYDAVNHDIYVSNFDCNTVTIIDTSTGSVLKNLDVGLEPVAVSYDPANDETYVADTASNNIAVINGSNNSLSRVIDVGAYPLSITFDPSNNDMYVVNANSKSVSVIDSTTNGVIGTVPVGSSPNAAAFDSADGRMYVANGDNTVSIIDNLTSVATVNVGDSPMFLAYDSANRDMYVSLYHNSISVIAPNLISSASPTTVLADGSTTSTVTFQTFDRRTGVPISVSSNLGSLSSPSCTTGIDGSCSVTIKSNSEGTATIIATASGYGTGTVLVAFSGFKLTTTNNAVYMYSGVAAVLKTPQWNVTLSSLNGFNGTVSLSYTSPTGLNCNPLSQSSITLTSTISSATTTLYCDASNSVHGTYLVNVTGASTPLTRSVAVTLVVRLKGDVDGNCVVNIADLAIVGSQFGKTLASQGFNPASDLNNDGVVSIVDLVLVAGGFGKRC